MRLEEAIDGFLHEREAQGLSEVKGDGRILRRLLSAVSSRVAPALVTTLQREDLDAVLLDSLGRGHAAQTRFRAAVVMGLFCRHLVKKGLLLVDPSRDLKVRRPASSVGFVPGPEAVKRLLDLARPESALARERLIEPPRGRKERELFERRRLRVVAETLRDRAILEVLYGSGLRFAELRALDVSDLHLAERTLFIRSGKGKKDRVVPLTRSSLKALVAYLSEGRPVLLSKKTAKAPWRGRAEPRALFLTVAATRLYDAWRPLYLAPLARAAGLPKGFGPHRLRHACAVHLLEDGADVVAISRLLGHASLAATAIYLRLTEAALHKAILAAHPRERSKE